jgi:hypothetical protein
MICLQVALIEEQKRQAADQLMALKLSVESEQVLWRKCRALLRDPKRPSFP